METKKFKYSDYYNYSFEKIAKIFSIIWLICVEPMILIEISNIAFKSTVNIIAKIIMIATFIISISMFFAVIIVSLVGLYYYLYYKNFKYKEIIISQNEIVYKDLKVEKKIKFDEIQKIDVILINKFFGEIVILDKKDKIKIGININNVHKLIKQLNMNLKSSKKDKLYSAEKMKKFIQLADESNKVYSYLKINKKKYSRYLVIAAIVLTVIGSSINITFNINIGICMIIVYIVVLFNIYSNIKK